ncbi:hypothetical protein [Microbacterium maritypicum]
MTNPWAVIIGPCYTRASLARVLRWTEQEVVDAAATLDLLELDTIEGKMLYPAFQIHDGQVIEGIKEVLEVLSTGTASRWTWAQWLNASVDDESDQQSPSAIEQLRAGHIDDVILDARHTAWSWSS